MLRGRYVPTAEKGRGRRMKAADIASKAAELVGGERAHVHGDKVINHDKIAAMWNGVLSAAGKVPAVPLDGHDVANMMEALKIARRYLGRFNPDDYVDGAGYAACAGEIAAAAEARLERASAGDGARWPLCIADTNP